MPNKQTHIDPDYLNNPADQSEADASAAEWLAYWERQLDAAMSVDAYDNAQKRIAFWRTMIKEAKPAPLTNEQRRARRQNEEK